jgi:CBS domain-containing protein
MRVRDVMTTEVVTITRTAPLKEVAGVLAERRISGAPVVLDGELPA